MNTTTVKGPVWTEALRIARLKIKRRLRELEQPISDFPWSQITEAAIELMKHDESIMLKAERNIKVLRKRKRK